MYQALIRALMSLSLAATLAGAAAADSLEILVDAPWARATVGAGRPAAVYLSLRNTGGDDLLLTGVQTEIAERAAVHISATDAKGVTTMKPAGEVAIPAGEDVVLQPGGLHIMLMGLTKPLTKGDSFRLGLMFDDGGTVPVTVQVRGIAATGPRD